MPTMGFKLGGRERPYPIERLYVYVCYAYVVYPKKLVYPEKLDSLCKLGCKGGLYVIYFDLSPSASM